MDLDITDDEATLAVAASEHSDRDRDLVGLERGADGGTVFGGPVLSRVDVDENLVGTG